MQASRGRLTRNRTLGRGPLRGAWPALISLAVAACNTREPDATSPTTLVPPLVLGSARQQLIEPTGAIIGSRILRVARDSFVSEAEPDRNFGSDTTLRIQGGEPSRALLAVDPSAVAQALGGQLVRARLEMPIVEASEDWGADQAVEAHRLRHGWEEGASTWNCAADSDPQNTSPDCSGDSAWRMRGPLSQIPWLEPATATALVSSGQSGTLELDVTRDVACGLSGLAPFDGWLLDKGGEAGPGVLALGSLESFDGAALLIEWAEQDGIVVDAADCSSQNPPDPCVPTASADTTCDGLDDDCDGTADEDFTSQATSCGVGACSAGGVTSCVLGQVLDSCQPGAPAAADSSCDGVDDDCDGASDEDYVPLATSCGIGACGATGASSCVLGQVLDSCQPGTPAASDANCDGVDDDCDGSADEDYTPLTTSCGIGACGATGASSCVLGQVLDSCQPGAPAASDANCDGVDDDCDGSADEDYAALASHCGTGACSAIGATSCVLAHVLDSCQPGAPAAADATCDGVDDDCDGVADEDYSPVCSGSNVLHCVAGALQPSDCSDANACNGAESCLAATCVPGTPPELDDTNPCTADSCDSALGAVHTPVAAHTACDDFFECDGASHCVSLLPPDPASVAPPLPAGYVSLLERMRFLFEGDDPIQTGVAPGTIRTRSAAVLRGRVLTSASQPLRGVTIRVHGHPELGETLSRLDGRFDLVVNGGGPLTLEYQRAGFLQAQRSLRAAAQDYAFASDVVLLHPDEAVSELTFPSVVPQQHAASTVSDADGTRSALLHVNSGTEAHWRMPDGSTPAVSEASLRATEYTVGDAGKSAQPAEPPATSGYTYSLELSADEQAAAGALGLEFSQPVTLLVENFLHFPTGRSVPVGAYDRDRSSWSSEINGRVIQVLGAQSGLATLDLDGKGAAASQAQLDALGITNEERLAIAQRYSVGASLWRATLSRTAAFDLNESVTALRGTGGVDADVPRAESPLDRPKLASGSSVELDNQLLGARLPLAGTDFSLSYQSDRVPSVSAQRRLDIPVTGASVSSTLAGEVVEIQVAGQRHVFEFPAQPNQSFTFTWDGLDAEQRPVQGRQPVFVNVGCKYPARYTRPSTSARAFGIPGTSSSADLPARQPGQVTVFQSYQLQVGQNDQFDQGLGAWSLSIHHRYDPVGRILYRGDGSRRSANSIADTIDRFAGIAHGTSQNDTGDGGLARNATLNEPRAVAVGPDGALYIGTRVGIRRVDPDTQIITTVAGGKPTGTCDPNLLDGVATNMCLFPRKLDFGPDGALYISDNPIGGGTIDRLRRLDLQTGLIRHVAGVAPGTGCANRGDGGPARTAALCTLVSHATGPDGSVYVIDRGSSANDGGIRRISPNGFIDTIAAGSWAGNDDSGDITVGPDGSLYVTGDRVIRRILPTGEERPFAGVAGTSGLTGDGGPATSATFGSGGPWSVMATPDGRVLVSDNGNLVLRLIDQRGIIHAFAGIGSSGATPGGDGGALLQAALGLGNLRSVLGPDGSLYFTSRGSQNIRKIRPTLEGNFAGDLLVPSEDGREVYRFDANGRHLQTLHGLTAGLLYSFQYDAEGRLSQVVDGDGNPTLIEHDAQGNPVGILAPFGQHTLLEADANGYLSRVTDPSGAITQLHYDELGLLQSQLNPRGGQSDYSYDAQGRLTLDQNPADGSLQLTRTGKAPLATVTRRSAEGLQAGYTTQTLSTDIERRTTLREDGRSERLDTRPDQLQTLTQFDGTIVTSTPGPDPVWGMAQPLSSSVTERLPSGSTRTIIETRTAVLGTAAQPLTLRSAVRSVSINAKTATTSFDALAHSLTFRSPRGRQHVALLDAQGRITQLSATGLLTSTFGYDAGRLVSFVQGSRSLSNGYDSAGQLSDSSDSLGNMDSFLRDANGRIIEHQRADGSAVGLGYDASGNLTSLVPPGRPAHVLAYTASDRLESYSAPNVGSADDLTSYVYDDDDRPTQIFRPDGSLVQLGYDAAGRLGSIATAQGSVALGYFPTTGHLQTVNGPAGVNLTFVRDGALLTNSTWSGAVAGSVAQTYDTFRRLSSESVNGANPVSFGYDDDGLITSAGVLSLVYNANLPLLSTTSCGQISDVRGYDGYGQLASYSARFGGTDFFAQSFSRDDLGRVQQKVETVQGVTTTYGYGYDSVGRLVSVNVNGTLAREYSYDANGNRLSTRAGSALTSGSYDDQDRLLGYGDLEYTYTRDGALHTKTNLVTGDITTYDYDALGNLLSVELPDGRLIEYVVDGLGRRVGKKLNGAFVQKWLYRDGQSPVAELNAAGTLVQRFVYGSRPNVPEYVLRGGATYRVLVDDLGSVRRIVNVANSTDVLSSASYDELGVPTGSGLGATPFGFAGALYDADTGLARSAARDYDAQAGRWLAPDPQRWQNGQANLYTYQNDNPVNPAQSTEDPLTLAQSKLAPAEWRAQPAPLLAPQAPGSQRLALELAQLVPTAPAARPAAP
jgi:RHS repeat-associated protein